MRCAIVGDPVDHSLSPVIHAAAYDGLGLEDWEYDAVLVSPGNLAAYVEGLDPREWRGLSVTKPLKREAVPLLTSMDEWTRASGACNTILLDPDGTRHGLNTDVTGAVRVLAEADVDCAEAVVLGGGATATSVLLALAERGLRRATIAVRDPDRAAPAVTAVTAHRGGPEVEVVALGEASVLSGDVVVSTVPASAQTLDVLASVADVPVVFDVVYDPWPTPLAAAAERTGRTVLSGLDLIVAQAVDQLRAMTGHDDVPAAAMRRAAQDELDARGR